VRRTFVLILQILIRLSDCCNSGETTAEIAAQGPFLLLPQTDRPQGLHAGKELSCTQFPVAFRYPILTSVTVNTAVSFNASQRSHNFADVSKEHGTGSKVKSSRPQHGPRAPFTCRKPTLNFSSPGRDSEIQRRFLMAVTMDARGSVVG
jgi:hypothetical protein